MSLSIFLKNRDKRPAKSSTIYWLLGGVALFTTGCYFSAPMGGLTEIAISPDLSPEQLDLVLRAIDEIHLQIGRQVLKPVIGRGLISKGKRRITVDNNISTLGPMTGPTYVQADAHRKARGCAIHLRTNVQHTGTVKHEIMHCFGYKHSSEPEDLMYYLAYDIDMDLPQYILDDFKKYDSELYDYDTTH